MINTQLDEDRFVMRWNIENFNPYTQHLISPIFYDSKNNRKWDLELYSTVNVNNNDANFVSIFVRYQSPLASLSWPSPSKHYPQTFKQIICSIVDSQNMNLYSMINEIDECNHNHRIWGWPNFIFHDVLFDPAKCLLSENNTIMIKCEVIFTKIVDVVESIEESIVEPIVDPIEKSTVDPVVKSILEHIVGSTLEPIGESTSEAIGESTLEPIGESTLEPIGESTLEPIGESISEPIVEPTFPKIEIPECRLSNDLAQMLDNRKYSDVLMEVQGIKYSGHKMILASRSTVFADLFESQTENRIIITDIEPNVFLEILRFIYTGKEPDFRQVDADKLLIAAHNYNLERLKMMCEDNLIPKLSYHNANRMAHLADIYDATILKEQALRYVLNIL